MPYRTCQYRASHASFSNLMPSRPFRHKLIAGACRSSRAKWLTRHRACWRTSTVSGRVRFAGRARSLMPPCRRAVRRCCIAFREHEWMTEVGEPKITRQCPEVGHRDNRAGRLFAKPGDVQSSLPIEKGIVQFNVPNRERQDSRFCIRFSCERPVERSHDEPPGDRRLAAIHTQHQVG